MAGPHEPSQQSVPFMERLPVPSNANQAALSRVFARLSAALPQQQSQHVASPCSATWSPSADDWPKALASQPSIERTLRPRTAYRETSPRKKQPLQRGRSNSVDRQRMTSPGRLYSSGRQTGREGFGNRNPGLEGLEVRDHQLKQIRQQCATAANKCRELQEALREKDGEISSLKARNAKLRSEKANERMKRQMNAVDQVLQPEDAAGARLVEGPGFGKDHRLALLIKKVKSLEESREEALSLAERAQAAMVPVKEALDFKTREFEDLEKQYQAQSHEMEKERSAKEKLESHIKAAVDARNQMQSEMEHKRSEFERVCAEVDSLRLVRADLLERTVKRDRKVDALQKKVKALAETLEVEQKARAKAEDDVANLEDRMRTIRKRSAALEGRCNQEKEQKEALLRDVQMKEEECCLLVKMVSNPLAQDAQTDRLSDADTIAEQGERIKILLAEVSRLRFAAQKADSPLPQHPTETPNPEQGRASPFDSGEWGRAPSIRSNGTAATITRSQSSRLPHDALEAAARLARRRSSVKATRVNQAKRASTQASESNFGVEEPFADEAFIAKPFVEDVQVRVQSLETEAERPERESYYEDVQERSGLPDADGDSDSDSSEWEETEDEGNGLEEGTSDVPLVQIVL